MDVWVAEQQEATQETLTFQSLLFLRHPDAQSSVRATPSAEARWDDLTLAIARQIARGEDSIQLPPDTDDESAASYVYRLQRIQNRLTFLRFVAADLERYTRGIGNRAIDQRDIVLVGDSREDYWEQKCFMERYLPPPLKPETDDVVGRGDPMAQMFSQPYRPLSQPQDDGATLHQAFDAYKTWIREYYTTDTAGTLSEHGYTKLGQIDTLKGHHTDARLSEIDLDFIEKMYRYCGSGP